MTTTLTIVLIGHVLLGLCGLALSYVLVLSLFKKGSSIVARVRIAWLASIAYILSWILGGYYYVVHYGGNVKPTIVEGMYPWAHLVFMEFKEHVFLFLPFATAALALSVSRIHEEKHAEYLIYVRILAILITSLATVVTLSGILVSGGAG